LVKREVCHADRNCTGSGRRARARGSAATGHEDEKGESGNRWRSSTARRRRKDGEIDTAVTLGTLLEKKGEGAFQSSKAARVEGTLVAGRDREDGDIHMTLAPEGKEADTKHWVIAEVTPDWQKQDPSLKLAALKERRGKKVTVTGWLYYEPDEEYQDPRGTLWELHPVTSVR
jgi:hypothetical protein